MLATSTHDTKRSEDVRARLALLSEIPEAWASTVTRFSEMNEHFKSEGVPEGTSELLLYQTLVGAWPIETDRVVAYMEKASREAKVNTSWTSPDAAYDSALRGFVESIMDDDTFTEELETFVAPLIEPGRINSLAMTLLKLTAPGVPDIYQGTETWDLSLVDPDNRRDPRISEKDALLGSLGDAPPGIEDDGALKLFVIHRTLLERASRPASFAGSYERISFQDEHLVGFRRGEDVIVVVPRLVLSRPPEWGETTVQLPAGTWRSAFDGTSLMGDVDAGELLGRCPVALLMKEES